MSAATFEREYSSFRDPDGFVVCRGDRVFRSISAPAFDVLRKLDASGLKQQLEQSGLLISTDLNVPAAELAELRRSFPEFPHFIEHRRVPLISYPYEWTPTMLCDAGLLHLELQLNLLERGFSLKDASAFNVQFIDSKPVFIDLLSIEPLKSPYWAAYGQFCRMFLYPLLLAKSGRLTNKSYFLPAVGGLSVDEAYRTLGFWKSIRPSSFMHLFLPYWLQRRNKGATPAIPNKTPDRTPNPKAQMFLVKGLLRSLRNLRGQIGHWPSTWLDYSTNNSYDAVARDEKLRFVEHFLTSEKPRTVLDLGSNTGVYSELAAKTAERVVAIDSDAACIDILYRRAQESAARIQPMWMDLANPSPPLGFHGQERKGFFDRVSGDAVLALALVHHLLVTAEVPAVNIRDCLLSLTSRHLLVEYVSPSDNQFISLVGLRDRDYSFFSESYFENLFSASATLVRSLKLSATRTLYLFEKK